MSPQQSIVFSPEMDERQLSKETKKVNQELNESTKDIKPGFDSSGMDSLRPAGSGGGGMGVGGTAGTAALASRIPKPMAGVAAASVVPVGLAGGVGMGMLKAMHGASARLQTSTSLLGVAWNNVWRPLGNRLDELFIRDAVKDIVENTGEFEDHLQNSFESDSFRESWAERGRALADLMDTLPGSWSSFMSDALDGLADLVAGEFEWPSLPDFDWPTLPSFQWPEINTPEWPDITTSGVLDSIDWPTLTFDNVMRYLTDPSAGSDSGGGSSSRDYGSVTRNRNGDPLSGTRATGRERNASTAGNSNTGGGMEGVKREIQKLNDAVTNMGIEVDSETLGRVTDDAQKNRIASNDPTVL